MARDRGGYRIVCYTDRWNDHILGGHPELSGHLEWVEETITAPLGIVASAYEPSSKVFYREYDFGGLLGRAFLRVVVRYKRRFGVGPTQGRVVTAYPQAVTPLKRGEKQLWP